MKTILTALAGFGLIVPIAACSSPGTAGDDDVATPQDAAVEAEAAGPKEICNFADDDGDGLVDEGFAWVAGPQHTVHVTTRFASLSTAALLPDGNVAVVGVDNYGEPGDELFVLIVSPAGELLKGPAALPIGAATNGTGVAQLPSGDLAVIFGSTDWAGCKSGCPVHIVTLDPSNLSVKNDVLLTSAQGLQGPYQLACTAGSCVTALGWPDGRSFGLAWFDPLTGAVLRTMEWPGNGTGMFTARDVVAWVASIPTGDPPQSRLHFGVRSLDGTQEIVPAKVVAEGGTMTLPNSAAIALLKDSALLSYGLTTDGGMEANAMVVGLDGVVRVEPALPGQYTGAFFAAAVGDSPIVTGVLNRVSSSVWRLGPDLVPLNVPNNPMSFNFALGSTNMAVDGGMLLVSATYDGHTVDVAHVGCYGGEQ